MLLGPIRSRILWRFCAPWLLVLAVVIACAGTAPSGFLVWSHAQQVALPLEVPVRENSDLTAGLGIKAHWNLSELIGSSVNAYDAVADDVDGDGVPEVIVSKDGRCEFYCLKADGSELWHTPILSYHSPGYYGTRVLDIDGDGDLEFVAVADHIWVLDAETGAQEWAVLGIGDEPAESPWTLGHVTSAEQWDIIVARAKGESFVVSVYDASGERAWSYAIQDASYGHTISTGDVDRDGRDEIVVPCSRQTVALDDDGRLLWSAPLTTVALELAVDFSRLHGLETPGGGDEVDGWWYHSDFAEIVNLYGDGSYYVLHDFGGGVLDPTIIQVLDALSGEVIVSFASAGHHQWLRAGDLVADSPGQELVYVTREKVVMRSSNLEVLWERSLSGAHELGLGDWDGDGNADILVSTIFRGQRRFAGVDSNFVVYNSAGDVLYNMLFQYPEQAGAYAGAQMQGTMQQVRDIDGDGHVDVAICFSDHDLGKFASSQDVHQYILSAPATGYRNEYHAWGNASTALMTDTLFVEDVLRLGYLVPESEYSADGVSAKVLLHMNEGVGTLVADSSGLGNDGILYDGEWAEEGWFGRAIRFDGSNTVAVVPENDSLATDKVAIELWMKARDTGQAQSIVERPGAYGLEITADRELRFWVRDPLALRWSLVHVAAPFTEFDRFVHVVATYDGIALRLVLDGMLVAADNHRGSIDPGLLGTWGMYIGDDHTRTKPFQGVMDELRLSGGVIGLPAKAAGTWLSQQISAESSGGFGSLSFDQVLNGGHVFYEVLDENERPISGHTNITSSPHPFVGIDGPIRIRAHLVRGLQAESSPEVGSVWITGTRYTYLPLVLREGQ